MENINPVPITADENINASDGQNQDIKGPVVSRDASYTVVYSEEGVYIEIIKEEGDGAPLAQQALLYDIERRNIQGVKYDSLKFSLRQGAERIKIADAQEQQPADSDVFAEAAQDRMSAYLVMLAPVLSGQTRTADEILGRLKDKWQIEFGVNEELVRALVQSRSYGKRVLFAQGIAPVKGKDGELKFLFSTKHTIAPTILEDGSADFKNLDLFDSVTEGKEVVVAVPPEEGTDGRDVAGNVLPAPKGKEYKLPKGKNVKVSEDGTALLAAKSGRVDYINGRVEISDVYMVKSDVDMSVGNVTFEGDIVVQGNVISGLTLQASGFIEVRGYVEGATLIAGKDIVLRNGMQGMSQGKLEAGGNIVARFIERATISAKGDIVSDYIVQCIVSAGGAVTLKGKWGKVLGGVVRAGKEVTARMIGSPSNDRTQLELGVLPDERSRFTKLNDEKGQIKAQLNRVSNILGVMPTTELPPEKQAIRDKLAAAAEQLEQQYSELLIEIEQLKQLLSSNSGARINVIKTIYPNVRIQIDSGVMTTSSTIEFATFRCKDGAISFTACEIKQ